MSTPRPGFASGFLTSFGSAFRTALGVKRAALLVLVLVVPPVLAFVAHALSPEPVEALNAIVLFLHLQFLAPMTGLLFGIGILAEERSGGTLPYVFTRPSPRSSLVLGKFAASVLMGWVAISLSVGGVLLAYGSDAPAGFGMRAIGAVLLVTPAYLGVFALLSALTRWGLLIGFVYAFLIEGLLSLIPGMVREATLLYYSRSIIAKWVEKQQLGLLAFGERRVGADPELSVIVLISVTVVALVASVLVVRTKEFVARSASA